MVSDDTYEHPWMSDNRLEKTFGKLESDAVPLIKQLIYGIERIYKKDKRIDKLLPDIYQLIPYVLIFYFRSGALLQEYSFDAVNPKEKGVRRLMDTLVNHDYIRGLSHTIEKCYDCSIIIDEKQRFLISDQYMSTVALRYKNKFMDVSNRQIGMVDTMLLIPLSSKFYIIFYNGRNPKYIRRGRFSLLNNKELTEINNVILNNSYHYCAGKFKTILENNLDKLDGTHYPRLSIAEQKNGLLIGNIMKKEVFYYEDDADMCLYSFQYCATYRNKIKGKIHRNDKCICGSGKKYKKCCMEKYERAEQIIRESQLMKNYAIPGAEIIEGPILDYVGYGKDLPEGLKKQVFEAKKKMK